jgi:hypothetical protein
MMGEVREDGKGNWKVWIRFKSGTSCTTVNSCPVTYDVNETSDVLGHEPMYCHFYC